MQKRQPVPGPYSQMVRRMQGKMRQLQDELALESVTNIEFEEASRRSFDYLSKQVKTLKDAFNTLTDTLLQELDAMGTKVDDRLLRAFDQVDDKLNRAFDQVDDKLGGSVDHKRQLLTLQENQAAIVREMAQTTARQHELERSNSQLTRDLEAILGVIPKLEDKIDGVAVDMSKIRDAVNVRLADDSAQQALAAADRLEGRLRDVAAELRDDLEKRHLKLQRSVSRQLDTMSKVLVEGGGASSPIARRVDFDTAPSPTFSGVEGRVRGDGAASPRAASSARAFSPIREASLRNLRLP